MRLNYNTGSSYVEAWKRRGWRGLSKELWFCYSIYICKYIRAVRVELRKIWEQLSG
jgi:hypothetical protein